MTQCLFQGRALSINACLQLALAATSFAGCDLSDDESSSDRTPSSYFDGISDSGFPNRPHDDRDASPDHDASFDAAQSDAGSDSVARGRYLVHHVTACVECHTPRDVVGRLDESLLLSGVECFRDGSPNHDRTGCQHTANLTDHETGLKNRSDLEIKAMFLEGMRPNGQALHPNMPYWVFGNMSDSDADAIVAYLRTVPGIDHMVPASQAPFDDVAAPAERWPMAELPVPLASYPEQAAAQRGRYLAANLGACIDCHTPRNADGAPDFARAFRGGLIYDRAELGLPAGIFADAISTANLTPHDDGLAGWTVVDVVAALKDGVDREGTSLCPPMPGGMGAFGGMTDPDAEDIAHYLLSLPPGEGMVVDECSAPF